MFQLAILEVKCLITVTNQNLRFLHQKQELVEPLLSIVFLKQNVQMNPEKSKNKWSAEELSLGGTMGYISISLSSQRELKLSLIQINRTHQENN